MPKKEANKRFFTAIGPVHNGGRALGGGIASSDTRVGQRNQAAGRELPRVTTATTPDERRQEGIASHSENKLETGSKTTFRKQMRQVAEPYENR